MQAFTRQLSSGQSRMAEQVHVSRPFPQKWNIVHLWKSRCEGKDFIQPWVEPKVPVCFLQRQNLWSLLQAEDGFHYLYHVPSWVTLSWCLASARSTHWDSWIPKASETQDVLLRRSPRGAEGQGRSSGEGTLSPSVVPCYSGFTAVSLRPAPWSFTEPCGWDSPKSGWTWRLRESFRPNSKILSINQSFQELKLRCLFYNTVNESLALHPAKGNVIFTRFLLTPYLTILADGKVLYYPASFRVSSHQHSSERVCALLCVVLPGLSIWGPY